MKVQHPLFSQVALAQDLPEYNLKRGNVATIVEHYSKLNEVVTNPVGLQNRA
ncbi:DUF4926 domain-containing protein [Nostoc sp.]|uniref:DUF4926 domain-containing protein n=1 Tax=Nostoc sp. TaxID=1180 RepID=UPI002FF6E658